MKPVLQPVYSKLVKEVNATLAHSNSLDERASYEQALRLLEIMNFQSITYRAGTLTRFIIDSYTGDLNLGEKLIDFDEKYSRIQ